MTQNSTYGYILGLILILALSSCGINKFIPEGERLYTGSKIKAESKVEIDDIKKIENELKPLLGPKPNSDLLGMRPGLYFHYKAQREKPGFIYKALNKSFGQTPVYFSAVDRNRAGDLVLNRLENRGFFYSTITSELDTAGRLAGVNYSVRLEAPYILGKFELDTGSLPIYNEIEKILTETENETKLKPGSRYDLSTMEAERVRIDAELKKRGYYNFNPDFLLFEADTNRLGRNSFELFLRLKQGVPPRSVIPYTIDSISVFPNYSINTDSVKLHQTLFNGVNFIQGEEFFKIKKLHPYILIQNSQKYESHSARSTSSRLSAIGCYKYVNIRFKELDTTASASGTGSLKAEITLSPLTKRAVRTEFQAVTKSNGFAGPGLSMIYTDRNIFKGGENFSVTGYFAYETQLSNGKNTGLSSIVGGGQLSLSIPRLVPLSPSKFSYAVPRTKVNLGLDFLNRTRLYKLNSVNGSFGYVWNQNKYWYHEFYPLSLVYVRLAKTTLEFDTILSENPFLARSFQQQFIAGFNYTLTYNGLLNEEKKLPLYISTQLDVAGNALNLISGSSTFLGLEYAQYAKADLELRHYLTLGKDHLFISRVFAGLGVPYGNSTTLPFVKQFYSGGPYSVRAFKIRSLGPGSYVSANNDATGTTFFDQSGNLRFEANLEYRFPIWSYLKGALFADAGNVWLTGSPDAQDTTSLTEELYATGTFGSGWLGELGIGVGVGFRFDIQSFVIRLDLASPLSEPYLPEGSRSRVPFFGGGRGNIVYNFAIGYPF